MDRVIAVVPAPGFQSVLLGPGPCMSRAPSITDRRVVLPRFSMGPREELLGGWEATPVYDGSLMPSRVALPLWWDGKPVPQGVWLAANALFQYKPRGNWSPGLFLWERPGDLRDLALTLLEEGIASEVVDE